MNKEQLLNTIKKLSQSQGFYQRLYDSLTNGSEDTAEFLDLLEEQGFESEIDLIMFLEGS